MIVGVIPPAEAAIGAYAEFLYADAPDVSDIFDTLKRFLPAVRVDARGGVIAKGDKFIKFERTPDVWSAELNQDDDCKQQGRASNR